MNRKYALTLIIGSFAILIGLLAVAGIYPRFKRIEKRGPAPQSVAAIFSGDEDATAASIRDVFNNWRDFNRPDSIGHYKNKFPNGNQWSHFFLFGRNDEQNPLFPSDEEILLDRGVDSFVERYVSIPSALRTHDLYLYEPSGDYYWNSEYFYNGQPAKFRCSFLIHVEPAEQSGTKIEIFEYQPTIWVGKYLGLSAHAILPTMLHDIRPAEATTVDRKAVMAMIQGAKSSQSQDSAR